MSLISRSRNFLVFGLAGQEFVFPLEKVSEIVHMATLSRPPGLPHILEGFLNLGGTAIPVLRLDRLFQASEITTHLYSPLIIVQAHDGLLAILVDVVNQILAASEEAFVPIQKGHTFNDCAEAELQAKNKIIHLLSLERVLLEEEHERIREFQILEQQRLQSLQQ